MLKFDMSTLYKGSGVSQGLDRGLLVYDGDMPLVEEGMGLGACAFRIGGYTYFTSIKNIRRGEASFDVIYSIDRKLQLKLWGIRSPLFTRLKEYLALKVYMKREKSQERYLRLGTLFRKLLRMETCFLKVPPLGEVRVLYEIKNNDVLVDLSFAALKPAGKIYVMNELGGGLFKQSIIDGAPAAPPSGWQQMSGSCRLYSSAHSLSFTIRERYAPANVATKLCWGREQIGDDCRWAGFASEISCDSRVLDNYGYAIIFTEVAK